MKANANSIQDYLLATLKNAQDHFTTPPQLMYMVYNMDEIFQNEILSKELEMHSAAGFLALNSYVMLLAAVR